MFLDVLRRRNPEFLAAAIQLHQAGELPANSYAIDLDAVEGNARTIHAAATALGLKVFAMTKQVSRNKGFCEALMRAGITRSVAVDMECARATHRAGMSLGHIGHLVQVPRAEADTAAAMDPAYWTVFSDHKAAEAATAMSRRGKIVNLLARIVSEGDTFYRGHEGGFPAQSIVEVADRLDALGGARFAGITTFPSQLFDPRTRSIRPTPNTETLRRARDLLSKAGRHDLEINAPGTTSSVMLAALAEWGATQCEPGHGLTGTTPLHALEDLPERPAIAYVTEVSHLHGGSAFCFGGGLYVDPVFPDYQITALVAGRSAAGTLMPVEIPPPAAIDYYGIIDATGPRKPSEGDTVVFGFRPQAFVTRAYVAGIAGVAAGQPEVVSLCDAYGHPAIWPDSEALPKRMI